MHCLGSTRRWLVGFLITLCTLLLPTAALAADPPLAATTPYTINVPLLTALAGDSAYDANNWSVLWFGEVSADGNNSGDLRLLGQTDGVAVRAQLYDINATPGDVLTLELAGRTWRVPYQGALPETGDWQIGERCTNGTCRGWSADGLIPWSEFGGRPQEGATWPLRVVFDDADANGVTSQSQWPPGGTAGGVGTLHWGLPEYGGQETAGAQVLEVPLSGDSMLGGSTDCGTADFPDYFSTWGSRNFGTADHVNVQMQWDVADWPCYAKYYAAWSLNELPAGAEVVSATVELRQFGNPGFSPGYAEDGTKDTVMQVFAVDKAWDESTITWDNAPLPQENTSRTLVQPLPGDCAPTPFWYCRPGIPYQFDVTEIVRRAQAQGRSWASLALYTAAGQYHSGKYFYSREGAEPPVVRIAYLPGSAHGSPPAPRPVPAPTWEQAWKPAWEAVLKSGQGFLQVLRDPSQAAQPQGSTYYISPQGDDADDGMSAGAPWGTFGHAWEVLQPGDTLLLLDGTYTGATTGVVQPNIRNGAPGKPITIKALNDGKAVIDGEGSNIPVRLGENWGPHGPIGDWFVIDGLVARNGTLSNFRIEHGNHNVLRRISAYNVDPDDNSLAIGIVWSDDNLVEDFVAAGTGRYMANVFTSSGNTLRRGFTMWQQWDGRHFCGVSWPDGNNVGVYNSSSTTVENVIAYGRGLTGIFIQANDDAAVADDNQVLGSMALLQGADYDGSSWTYGTGERQPTARPGPITNPYGEPCPDNITQWEWGGHRQGFNLFGQGELHDNVFRDILATGNIGLGWASQHPYGLGPVGTVIDHATIYGNGSDITSWEAAQGGEIYIDRRNTVLNNGGLSISNSRIAHSEWAEQGEGARFQYRYVDRQLTDQPLLPWPMERRIKAELGLSAENIIKQYRP